MKSKLYIAMLIGLIVGLVTGLLIRAIPFLDGIIPDSINGLIAGGIAGAAVAVYMTTSGKS